MTYLNRVYVIKNDREEFYGKGGWVNGMANATQFCAEDALAMLTTFPGSTAIAITQRMGDRRQHSVVRSGEDRRKHEEPVAV